VVWGCLLGAAVITSNKGPEKIPAVASADVDVYIRTSKCVLRIRTLCMRPVSGPTGDCALKNRDARPVYVKPDTTRDAATGILYCSSQLKKRLHCCLTEIVGNLEAFFFNNCGCSHMYDIKLLP
jgi:hypothetical protein